MQFSRISNLRCNKIGGNPRLIYYSSVDKISTNSYIVSVIERKAMDNACVISFSIQSCRSCYATQHLCQRSLLKIVLIIVNINKDENKSLISNQFFLKNDL
jgi:hypothetical protein